MNRSHLAVATIFACLGACASPPADTWVKNGASAESLASDRSDCVQQARHSETDKAMWARPDVEVRKCMEAKGWRQEAQPAN
jgi:hypothetical protein